MVLVKLQRKVGVRHSVFTVLLCIGFLTSTMRTQLAQAEACPIPDCPSFTGKVAQCTCGKQEFSLTATGHSKFCCDGQEGKFLQDEPCTESLRKRVALEERFCSVSEIAAEEGLLVGYKLAPRVFIRVHRALVPFLNTVRPHILSAAYTIRQNDTQAFNPRAMRSDGGKNALPSIHAYGLAIDINWHSNPYCPLFSNIERCAECQSALVSDIPKEVIDAFERAGFEWGGRWSVPDAMHFELSEKAWPKKTCAQWRQESLR